MTNQMETITVLRTNSTNRRTSKPRSRQARRHASIVGTLGALVAAALVFVTTPALAALHFPPSANQIAGPSMGNPFSQLKSESVAVNDSNGHVLVAESGTGLVYDFTSAADVTPTTWDGSGTPAGSFGGASVAVAVDNATGDVYVADATHAVVDKFDAAGSLITTFGDTTPAVDGQLAGTASPAGSFAPAAAGTFGIAVNQATHDLYVLDAGHQVIDVFDATGAYQSQISDPAATAAGLYGCGGAYADGLAVSSASGHVFVSDSCSAQAFEFDGSGNYVKVWTGSNTPAGSFGTGYISVGLDDASGHVYISATAPVVTDAFDASGAYLGQITGTPAGSFGAVAADPATGDVYVSDSSTGAVGIFGPGVVLPDAVTNPASSVGSSSVTLNGHLDPAGAGNTTNCHFDYVDDASFRTNGFAGAQTVPCAEGNVFAAAADVHADINGLTAGTLYHFRLEAGNPSGTTVGPTQIFISRGAGFGFKSFVFKAIDQNGQPYTQAGGHPYELQTNLTLNTIVDRDGNPLPDGTLKDVIVSLPPGLVGDPSATPTCNYGDLTNNDCPPSAQIGIIQVDAGGTLNPFPPEGAPIYNMERPANLPAQFGFNITPVTGFIDSRVRTGTDYGIDSQVLNVSAAVPILATRLTLWGVPADPSHNAQRDCPGVLVHFGCGTAQPLAPLLTNPTSCSGPLTITARADSWQDVGHFVTATQTLPAITGCDQLSFNPGISIQPDTSSADSPSGLNVDVHVPLGGLQAPNGVATSNLKQAVVTLPPGVSVNPASADGLGACSPAQVALSSPDPANCPDNAKVGSVEVDTPLLPDPLKGGVYLAKQNDNPFGSLLAIYVTAEADGVVIKLAGHVKADPATGQLTTTFDNNPPLPFSDFKLDFFGGPRAALATPDACGAFTSTSALAPWSGTAAMAPTDSFTIDSGCTGGFAPGFSAGATNPSSGQGTDFTLQVTRADGQQHIRSITTSLPAGLLANIASVPLCGDAQASAGSCDAGSQVGVTDAAAGAGSNPFHIAGRVYLTGPYKGAPYGLSIVVPAIAGPYNLGTVVVRAAIFVDPHDSHVTVVSDDVPNVLDAVGADGQTNGFPLRVRSILVDVDRPGFMVNPTSCEPAAVSGSVSSWEGSSAAVASRFQIGNCAALPFSPTFSASTTAKTSRANGASLDAKILIGVQGESNAHIVAVSLPKQLPSRLTTIQKACLAATFNANPAACPAASLVGTATAVTPLLPAPLSGPAYLVSHGGAGFPDLVIVLQGNGVTFDLVGAINISSKGITSTKFANAPDVPINSFELKLPQGPHSILTSNGSLCAKPLVMPTTITAFNDKQVIQSTKIKVTGCPKAKRAKKVKRHKVKHAKHKAGRGHKSSRTK